MNLRTKVALVAALAFLAQPSPVVLPTPPAPTPREASTHFHPLPRRFNSAGYGRIR